MADLQPVNMDFMAYLKGKGSATLTEIKEHFSDPDYLMDFEIEKYESHGFIKRNGDTIIFITDEAQQGFELKKSDMF